MMKSAMRAALKESLVGMKKGLRSERGKSHIKARGGDTDDDDSGDSEGASAGSSKGIPGLAQRPGLSAKVGAAEAEGMKDLEMASPSESDASESWREDQKNFMKGRRAPSGKKTAFAVAVAPGKNGGKQKSGGKFGKKGG